MGTQLPFSLLDAHVAQSAYQDESRSIFGWFRAKLGRCRTDCGRFRATFARMRPNSAQIAAAYVFRSVPGKCWWNLFQIWAHVVKSWSLFWLSLPRRTMPKLRRNPPAERRTTAESMPYECRIRPQALEEGEHRCRWHGAPRRTSLSSSRPPLPQKFKICAFLLKGQRARSKPVEDNSPPPFSAQEPTPDEQHWPKRTPWSYT